MVPARAWGPVPSEPDVWTSCQPQPWSTGTFPTLLNPADPLLPQPPFQDGKELNSEPSLLPSPVLMQLLLKTLAMGLCVWAGVRSTAVPHGSLAAGEMCCDHPPGAFPWPPHPLPPSCPAGLQ